MVVLEDEEDNSDLKTFIPTGMEHLLMGDEAEILQPDLQQQYHQALVTKPGDGEGTHLKRLPVASMTAWREQGGISAPSTIEDVSDTEVNGLVKLHETQYGTFVEEGVPNINDKDPRGRCLRGLSGRWSLGRNLSTLLPVKLFTTGLVALPGLVVGRRVREDIRPERCQHFQEPKPTGVVLVVEAPANRKKPRKGKKEPEVRPPCNPKTAPERMIIELPEAPMERNDQERAFGEKFLGFPVLRRPTDCQRMMQTIPHEDIETFQAACPVTIGDILTLDQKAQVWDLIYTWRDLFQCSIDHIPATDLVVHYIPTYPEAVPVKWQPRNYSAEDQKFYDIVIPKLVASGIITWTQSPWSAHTMLLRKEGVTDAPPEKSLRMVHVFTRINAATIKCHYPMQRPETVINCLGRNNFSMFMKTDQSNGYWGVPLYLPDAYKTAFATSHGQFAYLRMGQGLQEPRLLSTN
jgi:hypothetical protein